MIQIEEVEINDFRGIRRATIALNRKSLVIVGPNGSGKSSVVDAIQFALSGTIERLTGEGTKDLSLTAHGPHITAVSQPEKAWVRLAVYIPHLQRSATIIRSVKKARQPKIDPPDPDVLQVFAFLNEHNELSLSRREIIKFILTEDGQRSTDVQTLLRLQLVDRARSVLGTARNRLERTESQLESVLTASGQIVQNHFGLAPTDPDGILAEVNRYRCYLKLAALTEWRPGQPVTAGLSDFDKAQSGGVSKEAALALIEAIRTGPDLGPGSATANLSDHLSKLVDDATLQSSMRRLQLLELGSTLVDSDECPLCETDWDRERLGAQLVTRIEGSRATSELRGRLLADGRLLGDEANQYAHHIEQLSPLPEAAGAVATLLKNWAHELRSTAAECASFDGIQRGASRLKAGWLSLTREREAALTALTEHLCERPEQEGTASGRNFLVVAEQLLADFHDAQTKYEAAAVCATRARTAYSLFVETADKELEKLYREVEADFCNYYRGLNIDDESSFIAKLTPDDASLAFAVDFYNYGLFPPGALHSEGHQDGMGVCLYLALIKRTLGTTPTVLVLDDVVMSVDVAHRRRFCDLLQREFPEVQFVITTHDELWAMQIRSAGVVDSAGLLTLHSWDFDTGPLIEAGADCWNQIDADLEKNDVPSAAAKLRRHLEFAMGELADKTAAHIQYRADGAYDLGDKLNAVLGRQRELLKKAQKAAKSWGQQDAGDRIAAVQTAFDAAVVDRSSEQWLINKAVHYNEWARLVRQDFEPVVMAFRQLLDIWQCPECRTSLELTSRINPKGIRCRCGRIDFNLIAK